MKKIELLNKKSLIPLVSDNSVDGCKSIYSSALEVAPSYVEIDLSEIKNRVSKHINYERQKGDLRKIFCVMDFKKELLLEFLEKNASGSAFRILIASRSEDHVQDDFSLIFMPLDEDGVEKVSDESYVIECQRPPGCRVGKSAVIEEDDLRIMFS